MVRSSGDLVSAMSVKHYIQTILEFSKDFRILITWGAGANPRLPFGEHRTKCGDKHSHSLLYSDQMNLIHSYMSLEYGMEPTAPYRRSRDQT